MTEGEERLELLASAAMNGQEHALTRLMARSWTMAFRLATRLVGDRDAAEDIAQAACERVLRSLHVLRSASAYGAWFYSIVSRIAVRERTISGRQVSLESCDSAVVADRTDSVVVNDAIDRLPLRLRNIVIMFYGCDLTTLEIARSLSIPHGTVRYRLHEARKRLREMIDIDVHDESLGA